MVMIMIMEYLYIHIYLYIYICLYHVIMIKHFKNSTLLRLNPGG